MDKMNLYKQKNIDAVLVEKALKGDTEAFSKLVHKYEYKLYCFLYKITFSKEDAEDLCQETFIRAYNKLYKYDDRWAFTTWLYKMAINVSNNSYKKKKHSTCSYDEVPDVQCDLNDLPEIAFEIKDNRKQFFKLINSLSFEQKTAVCLRYFHDLAYKDIGHIMNISQDAARMKVQRAKNILCEKLDQLIKKGVI
ncbi:MAG: RNA polymerase sigma factor [Clostridiaceae bacterium]|nr:RNA polymerase sigma factor [Clostridiaceae bacterium]